MRVLLIALPIVSFLISCAGPEPQRLPEAASAPAPQTLPETTSVQQPPVPRPLPGATSAPQSRLPSGYALTDTTEWGNPLEDGKRAVLRRGREIIDTVDIDFGVAAVGTDSLVFFPVRTGSIPQRMDSTVWYETFLTSHVLWTPLRRRELSDVVPFFDANLSSPAMASESVIYWGFAPAEICRRYAMRYDFRTARLDSLFLGPGCERNTDYRYYYGVPQIRGAEVSFDGVVLDRKMWRKIREDPPPKR